MKLTTSVKRDHFKGWRLGAKKASSKEIEEAAARAFNEAMSDAYVCFRHGLKFGSKKARRPLVVEVRIPTGQHGYESIYCFDIESLVRDYFDDAALDPRYASNMRQISSALRKLADNIDKASRLWPSVPEA